ncbi:unnamed protein product [Ectocarpus sp. CCAP 1310/34]|nr:unnamed protein product [Ectocarpus sp. CCAP 1310/34]
MRSADMWTCPETRLEEEMLAPRTSAQLPPLTNETREWLAESETIVVMEPSLLFCAAPNTGSLQFRMLAKRMQGIPHWSTSNNRSLLFDREASELELLDTTDGQLMKEIYSENGSGWIKIAVVRDPVTRLLSSYLDLVDTWRARLILQWQPPANDTQSSDHNRRWLWQWWPETEPTDEVLQRGRGGGIKEDGDDHHREHSTAGTYAVRDGSDAVRIPTLVEVLEALKTDVWSAPVAFRPVSSLCGQRSSPFDSVIPFERLQKTSTEVVKSLPGDIWEAFGKSGWGPDGKHAFMDFDYGRGAWRGEATSGRGGEAVGGGTQTAEGNDMGDPFPRHARDLFEGENPCAWTEYYSDLEILDAVGVVYEMDYTHYRWYRLDVWKGKLNDCLGH